MGNPRLLPFYDTFTRLIGARTAQWQLVAQAGTAPGDTVLEIGAGTGTVLLLAKRAVGSATVIGLDPDRYALAHAHRRAVHQGLELRLDHGYADRLPYPDASIDRVLSSFMFHHLPDAEKSAALAEAHRVLIPGGSLHMVDLNGEHPGAVTRLLHRWHKRDEPDLSDGHAPLRGPEAATEGHVVALMRKAGFAEAAVVGHGRAAVGAVTFYRAERS
ncbi:class I SAM-dependent methyltransferase [Nocardiopsis exhalans]|uniref:Ubiquinone/menaquinone biosynthesis C-methylase UbiE n=2 Tax=Nocardiopsis TaxID=2013 RepID=A0A840W5L4_9ACTN|nr:MULTISPECIES: class I SAM-dependent methyltransferase [Nocardiopsis]MBB5492249.1 ubiquinone/menaquinone biosynthesis C-methylase UbiE [Nocardiopsis metallicus]USY18712.1 class I SAM-dependent methyltransferase [Nocardiopsis exhalans]